MTPPLAEPVTLELPAAPSIGVAPAVLREVAARPAYEAAKRVLDVVIAAVALVILLPALLVAMLAIRAADGGPALFSQVRVGRGGRRFRVRKLRSMVVDADSLRCDVLGLVQAGTLRFKLENDPRLTRVGRWLRRTSLDEVPQLWNVLRGDMTLVGPRPPLPEEVASYGPHERRRLEVEQGLTCIWQVEGRSLLPFERQVELDLEYIARRSIAYDLWLLARTVPAVLSGRGAY